MATTLQTQARDITKRYHQHYNARLAAKREEDKALKELSALLAKEGLDRIEVSFKDAKGVTRKMNIHVDSPKRSVVDIRRLQKHLKMEDFLRCISASQAAVREVAGTQVLQAVLVESTGEPKLYVDEV